MSKGKKVAKDLRSFKREVLSWILTLTLAVGAGYLLRQYVASVYEIPSRSMEETLQIGDRVLANKLDRSYERGDIIVFNAHDGFDLPGDPDVYTKRVIGVPGDTVECCGPNGQVILNDEPLEEPYVYNNDHYDFDLVTVPEGKLWVMGDHRSMSSDSRYRGLISQDEVVAVSFLRIWPLARFGSLN